MSEEIRVATEFYRPMPQPHEPWSPTYTNFLAYKMARSERIPLWFRVKSSGPVTLALGGANAGDFTAEFFKPYGQIVNNANAFQRGSMASTPQGTYYDPLNPIPSGANNFVPEVPDGYEIVYLLLSCKSTATAGSKTITVTLGSDTITMTIRVWGNITLPAAPTKQVMINLTSGTANKGVNGGYISDAKTVSATNDCTDLLVKYRTTPYMNGIAFLPISGGQLNIDYLSGSNSSYRQMFLNRVPAGSHKFWMLMPQTQAAHRSVATAQAAEATIAAQGLTSMLLYVWDEPTEDQATATAIKGILDNWYANSPNTRLYLTTYRDYFSKPGPIAAGLTLAYLASLGSRLILGPVINWIGGVYTPIGSYTNDSVGFYSACQENCGPTTNGNASSGHDTGVADLTYIDMPMVRRHAIMLLAMRSTWIDKTHFVLHYDSTQAWQQFSGTTSNPAQNPWLSARRFNVMGDGTVIYPAIPGWKPHVGVPAFTASSPAAVPSLRLLYIAHASFMVDLFNLYLTAQASNQADNLVTSQSVYSTDYEAYESLRDKIGTALENSTTIAAGADPIETVIPPEVIPTPDPTPDPPPIVPPVDPGNPVPPQPTPDPVVPPPLPPPPVIPQPPVPENTPETGDDSGPADPDLPEAIPSIIEGISGRVAVIDVDQGSCYVALCNTIRDFSVYAEQFSLGIAAGSYLQKPIEERISDKVLLLESNLRPLPALDSTLVDFFRDGTTEADYGNAARTRFLLSGGAPTISGKLLDLLGTSQSALRGIRWGLTSSNSSGLCPLINSGTIRLHYRPGYTGTPGMSGWDNLIFSAKDTAASPIFLTPNGLYLVHTDAGLIQFTVFNFDGSEKIVASGEWSPIAGDDYVIDATYDLSLGLVEIWVNGIFTARTFGSVELTRTNTVTVVGAGGHNSGFYSANFQLGGVTLLTTYRAWEKWVMMGIPLGERFNITAYNLSYGLLSDEQNAYRGAGSSDGGANL